MRALRRARALRAAAYAFPALMSLALVLAASIIPFGILLLPAWLAAAAWAFTPAGERCVVQLLVRARPAGPSERYALAPVAQILAEHGVTPMRHLLVTDRQGEQLQAFGTGTIVVSGGLVRAVAAGRLTPRAGAALIAHESGIRQSRLTRCDAALLVIMRPFQLWFSVVAGLWQAVGVILSPKLRWASVAIALCVQVWLGITQHPIYLVGAALISLTLMALALLRAWEQTRPRIGDAYIATTGLGPDYADFLLCHRSDNPSRDRALWIRQHALHPGPAWAPVYTSQP